MSAKTKKLLIRRRIKEVISIKKDLPINFVCEHCGKVQTFKLADNANTKFLTNGENNDENNNQTH